MFFVSIQCLLFVVLTDHKALVQSTCDTTKKTDLKEDVIGETKTFPWLGVLRFHIHEGDSLKVALTGIVLVKNNYCIANADDVGKIAHFKFKRESRAMFILNDNETWSSDVLSYMIHPEYEFATYNTIALIELGEYYQDNLKPICWPEYSYNTSTNLYVAGYTDENMFLEKIFYKLEYIDQSLCKEFYNRIGFKNAQYVPSHYFCAFAKNNKKNCVWDNGMALISNTTGPWVFIGFGVKGPGCAGPSRFIDIYRYLSWIESSTDRVM